MGKSSRPDIFRMGTDAGILVTNQITDEHRWFLAMEEVRQHFKGREYFKELPHYECTIFGVEKLKLLKLTEPLNFTDKGRKFAWRWNFVGDLLSQERWRSVRAGQMTLKRAIG